MTQPPLFEQTVGDYFADTVKKYGERTALVLVPSVLFFCLRRTDVVGTGQGYFEAPGPESDIRRIGSEKQLASSWIGVYRRQKGRQSGCVFGKRTRICHCEDTVKPYGRETAELTMDFIGDICSVQTGSSPGMDIFIYPCSVTDSY